MSVKNIEDLVHDWEGIGVVSRRDQQTGSWIFVALHDDTLGRPTGGCRYMRYATPADALTDAMRLGRGMTHKWAAVEMEFGGGKIVVAPGSDLDPDARHGLFRRVGELLASLRGAFSTGRDLGTTDDDMRAIREATEYVHGVDTPSDQARDPGLYTARGVQIAVHATARHLGWDGVAGRTILVQGIGDVGEPLARRLAADGARLLIADMDAARAASLAEELDGGCVDPELVYGTECDLFAPCAVGAILNERTIARLACAAVVGSANNQLATEEDAEWLHERGILYAPDYVANAGGAIAFGSIHLGITDEGELQQRVARIDHSLTAIFAEAARREESPARAAIRHVEAVLARARASRVR